MAGAVSLCDGDPAGVARQVAIDNGLPASSLVVQVGFYDENDLYGDFSGYKDFVAEGEGGYPEDEYNNAVMVKLNATEDTLMGGFVGKDEVSVGASAVAYAIDYSFLSLSESEEEPFEINKQYREHLVFNECRIHSNADIICSEQPAEFDESVVTASGELINIPGTITNPVTIAPIDWDMLRQQADAAGTLLTYQDFEGGSRSTDLDNLCSEERQIAGDNLGWVPYNRSGVVLAVHFGDHDGAIYYYSSVDDPPGNQTLVLGSFSCDRYRTDFPSKTNFTIASEIPLKLSPHGTESSPGKIGGEGNDKVILLSKENIEFASLYTLVLGVVVRTEKQFINQMVASGFAYTPDGSTLNPTKEFFFNMKVIADKGIFISGLHANVIRRMGEANASLFSFIFIDKFTSPCDHLVVRLGQL